jgi:hypothetical protein
VRDAGAVARDPHTMTFALVFEHADHRADADLAVVAQNLRNLVAVAVEGLQLEKVSRHPLAVLHVVTAAAPLKLPRTGGVRECRPALRCTLASCHPSLGACSRDLVGESCRRQSVHECSFFVNLLHYGIYLLESFVPIDPFSLPPSHLLKDIPLSLCLDRAVPSVELELLLAVCQCRPLGVPHRLPQTRVPPTLVVLFACAVNEPAGSELRHRQVHAHDDILVVDLLR